MNNPVMTTTSFVLLTKVYYTQIRIGLPTFQFHFPNFQSLNLTSSSFPQSRTRRTRRSHPHRHSSSSASVTYAVLLLTGVRNFLLTPPAPDFGCDDIGCVTPQLKKTIPKIRSPALNTLSTTSNQKTPLKRDFGKPKAARSCQVDFVRSYNCKNEVAVPQNSTSEVTCQEQKSRNLGVSDSADGGSCKNTNLEAKCFPFNKYSDEKCRVGGLNFGAHVVPLHGNEDYGLDSVDINATGMAGSQKEFENLTLIQKQLRQIENQQFSLLDLLQRFIGHSQNGMNSLEKRVNGPEKALEEMSHDLAISTRRVSDTDAAGNTCCMLPGAEFLSPKFWRTNKILQGAESVQICYAGGLGRASNAACIQQET